jgi:hypothetical protein
MLLLLLAVALVGGCTRKRGKGMPCDSTRDCREGLVCVGFCTTLDLFGEDKLVEEWRDDYNRKTRCTDDTPPCRLHGRCTWKEGRGCIATSDQACRRTIWCKQLGRCRAVKGRCRK